MREWIFKKPCYWPTVPRRLFLFTCPISVPIWLVGWIATIAYFTAVLAFVSSLLILLCPVAIVIKFWTGGKEDESLFDVVSEKIVPGFFDYVFYRLLFIK